MRRDIHEEEGGDPPCWSHLFADEADPDGDGRDDESPVVPRAAKRPGHDDEGDAPCQSSSA